MQQKRKPCGDPWQVIGRKQHYGINVPLFSLHSANSCGIGEYLDLLPLILWCKNVGFDVLQLLPLNDNGHETSPYSALSAFALNPLHLSVSALPFVEEADVKGLMPGLRDLNNTVRVDYPKIIAGKDHFLNSYWKKVHTKILASDNYHRFTLENHYWLKQYAVYKVLKEKYQWQSWTKWPDELQKPDLQLVEKLFEEHKEQALYHIGMQFLCFLQMETVKQYANRYGVFIMGDIPILINDDSADVWFHHGLFNRDFTAGAPPDMYAKEGQSWGTPIYNWEAVAADDWQWWRKRLEAAEKIYHIYRLDHVVGFFRFWAVPKGKKALEGFYHPANEELWIRLGKKILSELLASSSMLPIGEDLGVVPPIVRRILKELGICGTKVIRWERYWDGDGSFIPYDGYLQESMTTVSTHDSQTLYGWWFCNHEEAKVFASWKNWPYEQVLEPLQYAQIMWDSNHTSSLFHVNLLQEYLYGLREYRWQSFDDERINIPGTVSPSNWSYRFHLPLEVLVSSTPLKEFVNMALSPIPPIDLFRNSL